MSGCRFLIFFTKYLSSKQLVKTPQMQHCDSCGTATCANKQHGIVLTRFPRLGRALEHRSVAADAASARGVECDVIGAVTSLVPRLSETTFRPFFVRLLDWASRADAPPSRVVTFYRWVAGRVGFGSPLGSGRRSGRGRGRDNNLRYWWAREKKWG